MPFQLWSRHHDTFLMAHRAFTVCRSPLAQAFMSHSLDSNPDFGSSCFYSLQVTLGTSFHEPFVGLKS
jgi:hypothetical protein